MTVWADKVDWKRIHKQRKAAKERKAHGYKQAHVHYLANGTPLQVYVNENGRCFVWDKGQFWRIDLWLGLYYLSKQE